MCAIHVVEVASIILWIVASCVIHVTEDMIRAERYHCILPRICVYGSFLVVRVLVSDKYKIHECESHHGQHSTNDLLCTLHIGSYKGPLSYRRSITSCL